ncbi:MAG TPA: hypothetical protein PLU10_09105 [Chitinophagaceae bacterium]|nr:hypothetical protein [Chitinophagaceae bacterium]
MNYKFLISMALIAASVSACKKRSYTNDTTKPIITVVEPMDNDTVQISIDPEVHIEFTATDNEVLRTLHVTVTNASGTTLFAESPSVTGNSVYAYHNHFIPSNITTGQEITVTLKAVDANDNSVEKVIPIYLNP